MNTIIGLKELRQNTEKYIGAVKRGRSFTVVRRSKPIFKVGNVLNIPFEDKSFDVILADAVLMYFKFSELVQALNEMNRVAKRFIVLVERVSEKEKNNGFIWSRNYLKLLEDLGFSVQTRKLEEKDWPESEGWQKEGMIVVASRPV